ncbi:type IV pilin [Natrinema saccharevitans]|uniref:Type IV pilin n=1 Tax=Natrinema saccharevitans TaxID=301967 RepID=A0A1S8AX46_9EURY|nr:type IV pilin N-terminal domain-containing protein [Natrinema saccharevitans]OLZ41423.1 type IV pilin [Natrinema saccharevitans]
MKLENIGNWIHDDERGVSPVIGAILMVAITVILAAVIAAFVLDLGQGQSANAQAGISFDEDSSGSNTDVTVTINSVERADKINVSGCSDSKEWSSPSAGNSYTINGCSSGDTIQVIGTVDGSENVITDYEVNG